MMLFRDTRLIDVTSPAVRALDSMFVVTNPNVRHCVRVQPFPLVDLEPRVFEAHMGFFESIDLLLHSVILDREPERVHQRGWHALSTNPCASKRSDS